MLRLPPRVELVLLISRVFVPLPRSTLPVMSPPLRVTESDPEPLVYEPIEEEVPLMVKELLPSPAFTVPITEPPPRVKVSLPLPEVTEPTAPAPLSITRVLLVPSPRLRLPLNEPPV